MPAGTAFDVAHAIDRMLDSPCLKPEWRKWILEFVAAGYNERGQRIRRSDQLDQQMRLLECQECTEAAHCRPDCPVKPYHDLGPL